MAKYKIVNIQDSNQEVELVAVDEQEAVHEAIRELGWRLILSTQDYEEKMKRR